MSGLIIPIVLAFAGVIATMMTYRGIRRGGARYYTLEREAMLRQASLTLFASMLLFIGAVGMLAFNEFQESAAEAEAAAATATAVADPSVIESRPAAPNATPELNSMPPAPTETATPGPTATPTALICRASVEGTGDNGLTLRTAPGGEEIDILAEASILTVLTEEEPQEVNGLRWRKVRSLFGDEGWVAEDFITLGLGCE